LTVCCPLTALACAAKISKERLRSLPGAEAIKKKPELRTKEQMEADTVEREARKAAEAAEGLGRERQEAEMEARQDAEKEAAFSLNKVRHHPSRPSQRDDVWQACSLLNHARRVHRGRDTASEVCYDM